MAWSSLAPASRRLFLSLRTRTPSNVAYFHRRKPLMAESGGGSKISEFINKSGQSWKSIILRPEAPAAGFIVAALAYYYYARGQSKKEPSNHGDALQLVLTSTSHNSRKSFSQPSLVNNQATSMNADHDLIEPCEPCSDHSIETDDIQDGSEEEDACEYDESVLTPTACVAVNSQTPPCVAVNNQKPDMVNIIVPETVSNIAEPEADGADDEAKDTADAAGGESVKKRRRRSRPAKQETDE